MSVEEELETGTLGLINSKGVIEDGTIVHVTFACLSENDCVLCVGSADIPFSGDETVAEFGVTLSSNGD